jgi:hypothetical protein
LFALRWKNSLPNSFEETIIEPVIARKIPKYLLNVNISFRKIAPRRTTNTGAVLNTGTTLETSSKVIDFIYRYIGAIYTIPNRIDTERTLVEGILTYPNKGRIRPNKAPKIPVKKVTTTGFSIESFKTTLSTTLAKDQKKAAINAKVKNPGKFISGASLYSEVSNE